MFFNEDLYLEGGEPEMKVDDKPMTDEEISKACKDCKAEGLENVIGEGAGFYTYALEQLEVLNEGYFNLREKMMNVEHVASLKAKDGLISESEQILSESLDGFVNGLKNFFVKIGNTIKNLFNRFVEFIMGHVVSVKKIKEMNKEDAWKLYSSRLKDGKLQKVSIANYSSKEVDGITSKSFKLLMDLSNDVNSIVANANKKLSTDNANGLNYKDGFIKKAKAVYNGMGELGKKFLVKTGSDQAANVDASLTKSEKDLSKNLFEERFQFVVDYQKKLQLIKNDKEAAMKVVDAGIKSVNSLKSTDNSKVKANRSDAVKQIRWCGSYTLKLFSVLTSVMSEYYRESLKVVRHVVGAQAAADVKSDIKKLGEGFDYEAYFNEAFN